MIKKLVVFLAFATLGVVLAANIQGQVVRGKGKYISNKLTHLTPFISVEVRGDAQVDVWQQDSSVTVSGKVNLVSLSDIRVEGETLIIDFKSPVRIKGKHALHVTVGMPKLESVSVHGKGRVNIRERFSASHVTVSATDEAHVTGDWLKADLLRIQATNKAKINLKHMQVKKLEAALFDEAKMELAGSAEQTQLISNGSKKIDAANLRIQQAHVQVNAKGDVEVFVMETLKADALGRGEIIYHGRPVLTRSGDASHIQHAFED